MFSFVFDTDFFAPRPNPKEELQDSEHISSFDGLDSKGLSAMHIACATGAIEVVVELLSQGGDVNALSSCGSSPLHYASMNNRKGIVEILLRSGADASIPGANGLIAAELCSRPDVLEILFRERNGQISSPKKMHSNLNPDGQIISNLGYGAESATNYDMQIAQSTISQPRATNNDTSIADLEHTMARITMSAHREDRSVFSPGLLSAPSSQTLSEGVLRAAIETAEALKASNADCDRRRELFRCCQQIDDPKGPKKILNRLKIILQDDPSLVRVRAASQGACAADGATLLHCAAQWDNVEALRLLLESGPVPGPWTVDLQLIVTTLHQGRTPLHLAAEWGKESAARVLLEAMAASGHRNPVGVDAPGDLTGTTPLGWASRRAKGRPSVALQKALFSPGDQSILPRTPHTNRAKRCRRSETVSEPSQPRGPDVSYAFSEAAGWRGAMEDRTLLLCPVPSLPSWALFGVLDGHGGDFSASFLSQEIPSVFLQQVLEAQARGDWTDSDSFSQRNVVGNILRKTVLTADQRLRADPRMRVTVTMVPHRDDEGALRRVIHTQDGSGSTAVLCLLSCSALFVANVGDSRAVLARRTGDGAGLEAVPLTVDHKLSLPAEKQRALDAGGIVEPVSSDPAHGLQVRVEGHSTRLRMARSLGDFYLKQRDDLPAEKQVVTADPDVLVHHRSNSDVFVLLACDGIFDVVTNQEAVELLAARLALGGGIEGKDGDVGEAELAAACDSLLAECLDRGSTDNMTAIVVLLGEDVSAVSDAGGCGSPPTRVPEAASDEDPPASGGDVLVDGESIRVVDTPGSRHSPLPPNSGPADPSVAFVSPGPGTDEVISPIRATRLFSV